MPRMSVALILTVVIAAAGALAVTNAWRLVPTARQSTQLPDAQDPTPKTKATTSDIGPSFNCSNARATDEKLICSNPGLLRADAAMAEEYRKYREHADPLKRGEITQDQRAWIRARAAGCGLGRNTVPTVVNRSQYIQCLARQYEERTNDLKHRLAAQSAGSDMSVGTKPVGEFIAYGSRQGMDITVVSKQGLGSSHAVIHAHLTDENAAHYCVGYAHDPSQQCIEQYLRDTHFAESISANCETGTFTTFYGDELQFLGKNPSPGALAADRVRNLKTGMMLDGTSASGLPDDMEQFNALCPGRASAAAPGSAAVSSTPPERALPPSSTVDALASGAAALDKTLRDKPWMEGFLRAMRVNTRTGPMPPLSPAEKRCQQTLDRMALECKDESTQYPRCTPEAVQHDLDQCEADLRAEWLKSH
jgi:uncharacterized protein YecT (DUF1311 family)